MRTINFKTLAKLFVVVIMMSNSNLFAQEETLMQNERNRYRLIENQLTDDQKAMLQEQRELTQQNRQKLRESLSEEQLAIMNDATLTRTERREQLKASFTEEQLALVAAQQQTMKEARDQFRNSLTEEQKNSLQQRLQNRTNNSRDIGAMIRGEGQGSQKRGRNL